MPLVIGGSLALASACMWAVVQAVACRAEPTWAKTTAATSPVKNHHWSFIASPPFSLQNGEYGTQCMQAIVGFIEVSGLQRLLCEHDVERVHQLAVVNMHNPALDFRH